MILMAVLIHKSINVSPGGLGNIGKRILLGIRGALSCSEILLVYLLPEVPRKPGGSHRRACGYTNRTSRSLLSLNCLGY